MVLRLVGVVRMVDGMVFDCEVDALLMVSSATILLAVKLAFAAKALPVITILLMFCGKYC